MKPQTDLAQSIGVSDQAPWWRGAVIYQIYPRSFLDTNGDGIGDLEGITSKLDYVRDLGVDGIWISPFFKSPMKDFGYDVADYRAVDPIFGTLKDFDALLEAAHARKLKVIIDMVFAHTSDEHTWFVESRAGRHNPKSDWYVWSDPKADGSPPNNWQSVFAGPAWTWDARRRQYYMHQFLPGQPQLNVHNPAVQDALLAEARFWLERGADGFRLDAINHSMFDPQLRDNPSDPDSAKTATRPYNMQKHTRSQNHPDVTKFLERIRSLADEFGAIFTVAEIGGPDTMELMKDYTDTGRLRSAYSFDFLYANDLTPERVKQSILKWTDLDETHWPSWAFANHDAPRCVSRWYKGDDVPRFARMTNTLLMSLRGNPILFQGEELGLTQADIAFEDLQDPEAIANWPLTLGRDGARTPMVWTSDTYGRFSNVKPWLPVSEAHRGLAVAKQEKIPTSVLSYTQRLLKVRAASKALRLGALRCLDAAPGLLIFDRSVKEEVVHCVFNLSGTAVKSGTDFLQDADMLIASGWEEAAAGTIPAYSCWIGRRR